MLNTKLTCVLEVDNLDYIVELDCLGNYLLFILFVLFRSPAETLSVFEEYYNEYTRNKEIK